MHYYSNVVYSYIFKNATILPSSGISHTFIVTKLYRFSLDIENVTHRKEKPLHCSHEKQSTVDCFFFKELNDKLITEVNVILCGIAFHFYQFSHVVMKCNHCPNSGLYTDQP